MAEFYTYGERPDRQRYEGEGYKAAVPTDTPPATAISFEEALIDRLDTIISLLTEQRHHARMMDAQRVADAVQQRVAAEMARRRL